MPKISGVRSAVAEIEDDDEVAAHRGPMRSTLHTARDAETRPDVMPQFAPVSMTAENFTYERPNSMAAPPARPGYEQRWVRVGTREGADGANWMNKLREGYQPRPIETVPHEFRMMQATHQGVACIMTGQSILCEKPLQMVEAKRRFLRAEIDKMNASIQAQHKKVSDEGQKATGIPLLHEETERFTGGGRRPATMVS